MTDRLQRGADSHATGQLADSHRRQPLSERSVEEPGASTPFQEPTHEPTIPAVPNSLLADASLSRRGNAPTRQAALLNMQSTFGNRAVQRFLRRAADSAASDTTSTVQPQVQTQSNSPDSSPSQAQGFGSFLHVQRQPKDAGTEADPSGQLQAPPPAIAHAPSGGNWNADDKVKIGSIRRIHVAGLTEGNQVDDKEEGEEWGGEGKVKGITGESAVGQAVVLVPDPLGVAKNGPVDVMLYLHGYGIGYRQRTAPRMEEVPGGKKGEKKKYREVKGMETGTVRDVAVDHMEEQLDAINKASVKAGSRPMIAVMPQGRYTAQLGAQFGKKFNGDAYLDEVFGKVAALNGVARGRVVLAGHSGAGGTIAPILANAVNSKGELKSDAEMEKAGVPTNLSEVILFDAINTVASDKGPGQLERVEKWVVAQIKKDVREMTGISDVDQGTYLQNRMMRFRGYFSKGSSYAGRYATLKKDLSAAIDRELRRARGDKVNPLVLSPEHEKALRDNYVESIQEVATGHENVMGIGKVKEALTALPPVQPYRMSQAGMLSASTNASTNSKVRAGTNGATGV